MKSREECILDDDEKNDDKNDDVFDANYVIDNDVASVGNSVVMTTRVALQLNILNILSIHERISGRHRS